MIFDFHQTSFIATFTTDANDTQLTDQTHCCTFFNIFTGPRLLAYSAAACFAVRGQRPRLARVQLESHQRTAAAAITQQQLIETEPVHSGMLPSSVGGGELLPHYLDTCSRGGSLPLLEDQRNTEHHPASLSLPPQNSQVHLHPEVVSTGSGNSSMAPDLQASNQAPKHNQRRMDDLPGGFPLDETHSLATLAAEVKLEVQDMSGGASSQLQETTMTSGFSGFPTTFTLPQTDALGRTTSAKFRHSRQNSLCSEDEASAARGSQAGSDRDSPSHGKLERKPSIKSRGSPKDPSKVSEQKQLRSIRKREASKRRYMDQKQKLDELKAKSEELQVVNMHLKKDLASVYREIERLQQGQTQEMFTNFSQ